MPTAPLRPAATTTCQSRRRLRASVAVKQSSRAKAGSRQKLLKLLRRRFDAVEAAIEVSCCRAQIVGVAKTQDAGEPQRADKAVDRWRFVDPAPRQSRGDKDTAL